MTRGRRYDSRSRARQDEGDRSRGLAWLRSPLLQQAVGLLLIVLALLTVLSLLDLTAGRWTSAWVRGLRFLFGWGFVPITVAIGAAGFLILQHNLDQPVSWRWRPVVGLEMVFFGLLSLTHLIAGHADPWGLVESGWGGGLVGWAVSHSLSSYVGPLATGVLLAATVGVGIGLAFDLTLAEMRDWQRRARTRPTPPRRESQAVPQRRPPRAERRTTPPPPPATPPPSTVTVRRPEPAVREPPPPPRAEPIPLSAAALPDDLELPPLDLLQETEGVGLSDDEVREKSRTIVETLSQFGLPVQVVEVRRGPTVTQFGVAPGFTERAGPDGQRRVHKVRVSQISTLADDLALALAAPSLRVEAPVPGRPVVGIEVPNEEISLISLRSVMESEEFERQDSPLTIALGQDVAGEPVVADLGLMPHLLIAGTTGSGKSVCIKSIATCLTMANRPDELRLVMIDPKMVELVRFNGLPHVLGHTEYELDRVSRVLRWVALEMDRRYKSFAAVGARNLDDYNHRVHRRAPEERLPRIVVLIDELADLMMLAPEQTERTICRIAQMARATGIHLIVATQRPSVDVVTGLIKANFPARISFATASQVDSRVILDAPGAETLLGKGDMLYLAADAGHAVRVQGCHISEAEVEQIVSFWRSQVPGWETTGPWEAMTSGPSGAGRTPDEEEEDALLEQAIALVRRRKAVSASYLQRQLRVGYPRAARLMERLEEMGLVGPSEAAGRQRRVIGGERE